MRARSRATVAPGAVLAEVHSEPPLTLRQVSGPSGTCALCVVGSAAGPLPGDDHELRLTVLGDAHASLVATGASIAQGRGGPVARLRTTVTLGERAVLDAAPAALVVCAGAAVDAQVCVELQPTARLRWRELIVLGRTSDAAPGAATVRWDVVRGGTTLLRQDIDLTEPFASRRVLASELVCAPDLEARTTVLDAGAVAQRLDERALLLTVLGTDVADVLDRLSQLTGRTCARPTHA